MLIKKPQYFLILKITLFTVLYFMKLGITLRQTILLSL